LRAIGRDRRLAILDLMILIAAMAAAIVWTRATVAGILEILPFTPPGSGKPGLYYLIWWPPAAVPVLMTGSLAVALLRLRRPRPVWRRLARQPGAVACGVATAALGIQAALVIIGKCLARVPGMTSGRALGYNFPFSVAFARGLTIVGLAVIGAWLVLAAGRRWNAERSGIDLVGRLLGICWIGLFLIQRLVPYIMGG